MFLMEPGPRAMKGWIAITADDGQSGAYRPAAGYSFNDHTPHHRQVAVNDLFFLRNRDRLLTVGRVQRIEVDRIDKNIQRCPTCGTAQLGVRSTRAVSYRCLHGHEFLHPLASVRDSTEYKAHFALDYIDISATIETAELRPFELTNSRQLALRPGDLDGLLRYVARRDRNAAAIFRAWLAERNVRLADDEADDDDGSDLLDPRERQLTAVRIRRGRRPLREDLFRRYGARCMISGCKVAALLEAVQIQQTSDAKFKNPTNGLILRSDLHTLFDLNLVGIDPDRLTVAIHPSLADTEYQKFVDVPLLLGKGRAPNQRALAARWRGFRETAVEMPVPALAGDVPLAREDSDTAGGASRKFHV